MQRSVWIVPRARGAPEVSASRRDLARLTRLRWVAGRRSADESWDAYESPLGETLTTRLERPVSWNVEQDWMLDLTGELIAAANDGTMPGALSAQTLWVTPSDRIIVPDATARTANSTGTSGTGNASGAVGADSDPRAVVVAALEMVRAANGGAAPLPRHAAKAIAAAAAAGTVDEMQTIFKATVGRPTSISRIRRSGLIASTIGAVLFVPVLAIVPLRQQAKADPEGRKLSGLLQFIGDSAHAKPDSLRPKVPKRSGSMMTNFNSAMQKAGWFPTDTALDRLSPEEYQRQSRLAQVYLAATLAPRIHDSLSTSVYGRSPPEQRLAKSILQRIPVVDSSELRAARALVDSTWKGSPPGTTVDLLLRVVGAVLFVFIPWFVAGCAIVIAIVARRGPLMRGFQVDIVTGDGRPAGRARILVRNLVTWSLISAPQLIYLAVDASSQVHAAFVMGATALSIVLILAIGIWLSVRTPARGPADRIAGTWLVPE